MFFWMGQHLWNDHRGNNHPLTTYWSGYHPSTWISTWLAHEFPWFLLGFCNVSLRDRSMVHSKKQQEENWLVVWNMAFMTFHILGMSSFQLTNSYFSEGLVNHQPVKLINIPTWTILSFLVIFIWVLTHPKTSYTAPEHFFVMSHRVFELNPWFKVVWHIPFP